MSWQQGWGQQPGGQQPGQQQGGMPNWGAAAPFVPGAGAMPFYPHAHHHHHHHGGYQPQPFYPQQGYPQQGYGGGYQQQHNNFQPQFHHHHQHFQQHQQFQPQQQQQQQQGGFSAGAQAFVPAGFQPTGRGGGAAPAPTTTPTTTTAPVVAVAPPEEPKTISAAEAMSQKQSAQVVMPKRDGGKAKSISLGFKKKEEGPASATTATTASASSTAEKKETPTTSSPTTQQPASSEAQAESGSTTATEGESATAAATAASAPTTSSSSSSSTSGPAPKPKAKKINKQRQKEFVRDPRPHFNVVFCGHVDSGKSTSSGHLLADFGLVEEREMQKLRKEAEQFHREGWEYAYVMDLSEEERQKGKTHETGAAYFETEHRRVTILDAPGHNAFVGSMIGGAAQADVVVLIISAKTGEFESGFLKGGQTREHATLCRSCGVRHMIVGINKMDEVGWDKERYDSIVGEITPFLRQNGYDLAKPSTAVVLPLSGLTGLGLTRPVPPDACPWFKGPSLIEHINKLVLPATKTEQDDLCVPLVGAYKDEYGKIFIYGKVESGSVVIGDELVVMPGSRPCVVDGIQIENTELDKAYPGDNVHIRVTGINENDVHAGNVATTSDSKLRAVEYAMARVVLLDARNVVSAGSKAMMHIHTGAEEITFYQLLAKLDRKTWEVVEERPPFVRPGEAVLVRLEFAVPIVCAPFEEFEKLGRFVLRENGKTIGIGVITKLYEMTKEQARKKESAASRENAPGAVNVQGAAAAASASSG